MFSVYVELVMQAFKVLITSAAMHIRKVKVSSSVYLANAKTLEYGKAIYPFSRVIVKAFTIPT